MGSYYIWDACLICTVRTYPKMLTMCYIRFKLPYCLINCPLHSIYIFFHLLICKIIKGVIAPRMSSKARKIKIQIIFFIFLIFKKYRLNLIICLNFIMVRNYKKYLMTLIMELFCNIFCIYSTSRTF